MTTYKDALCLQAIFVAYGIVGRLDYEDAVRLEALRQERRYVECLTASSPAVHTPEARIDDPSQLFSDASSFATLSAFLWAEGPIPLETFALASAPFALASGPLTPG